MGAHELCYDPRYEVAHAVGGRVYLGWRLLIVESAAGGCGSDNGRRIRRGFWSRPQRKRRASAGRLLTKLRSLRFQRVLWGRLLSPWRMVRREWRRAGLPLWCGCGMCRDGEMQQKRQRYMWASMLLGTILYVNGCTTRRFPLPGPGALRRVSWPPARVGECKFACVQG